MRIDRFGRLIIAGVALIYLASLAPTFSWGDSADLPLRIFGDPAADTSGTVRDYFLYRLVGQAFLLIPFGDVAYRINLMSATFGLLGVTVLYALILRRTGRADAAAVAALALACSHTWWWMSAVSEVYTFAGALMLVSFWLWLEWLLRRDRRWLIAAALASGVTASAHGAGALLLVPLAVLLIHQRRELAFSDWLLIVVAGGVGASPLIVTFGEAWNRGGLLALRQTLDASNPNALGLSVRSLLRALALTFYQYPVVSFVLAAIGMTRAVRAGTVWDRFAAGSLALLVTWATLSRIPDVFNAYAIPFALLAVFVGLGAAPLLERLERSRRRAWLVAAVVVLPVALYSATAMAGERLGIDLTGARTIPGRNNNWYFLFPPKSYDEAPREFAERALDAAEPGALILADYTLWRPLRFLQQVEHRRPDLRVLIIDPYLGDPSLERLVLDDRQRAVYLAAIDPPAYYDVARLGGRFTFEPEGPLFKLRPR